MSLPVTRLRRWFLGAALLMSAVVAGFYFYARWQVAQKITKPLAKLGINIQQSAEGFTISRSEAGRTLFTIKAKKLIQLKLNGHATLEDVQIIVYGKDSTRYDQITAKHFDYDKASGEIAADGEVEIDLQGNAEGMLAPDQAMPKELKNTIHLKTNGLVFNQQSGDGYAKGRVEFVIPQASGSAVGARYNSLERSLTLESQVAMQTTAAGGNSPAQLSADRAVISEETRLVALQAARAASGGTAISAAAADLILRNDNSVDHISARGGVTLESAGQPATAPGRAASRSGSLRSQEATFVFGRGANRGVMQSAEFRGNVMGASTGVQPAEGSADRLTVQFLTVASGGKQGKTSMGAQSAHAEGNVRLAQLPSGTVRQRNELTAGAVDFLFGGGHRLQRAETVGPGQILIEDEAGSRPQPQRTVITAARLVALFDSAGHISNLHGEPDSRIVSSASGGAGQPARVSTANSLDVTFKGAGGVNTIVQRGRVHYQDQDREAWGDLGQYSLPDQMLTLKGDQSAPPRIADKGLVTTADQIRLSRLTGEAWAEGHVKSTYNELKPQPDGALLASGQPSHVTASSMHALNGTGVAEYRGAARLWQGANVVQAPLLRFERDTRRMVADRSPAEPVTMVLLQKARSGPQAGELVNLTTDHLEYSDLSRKVDLTGGVRAVSSSGSMTARQATMLLKGRTAGSGSLAATASGAVTPGQIEEITLLGDVKLQQGHRTATGERLVYQPEMGKYVLSGGLPSIFDAEHGKVTGVLLTFFDHDDKVLVQGEPATPTVTHTESGR